jgi:transposase
VEVSRVAKWNHLKEETLRKQYKNHLSNFHEWDQKEHAEEWILFPHNLGSRLSIDEVALSKGELYTLVTNKAARGRKGSLIAMIKGMKASDVCAVLQKIPIIKRTKVEEVTLDMSNSMDWIVRESFPNAKKITDRFHAQQLVSEAVQHMRVEKRWEAIEEENQLIQEARKAGARYRSYTYANGDTKKQLLARGRYVLFKPKSRWNEGQRKRAAILFETFPELKEGYELSMMFRGFYEYSRTREEAKQRLAKWYSNVDTKGFKFFVTAMESVKAHEGTILNYFPTRSTNASAESFNAKLKGFRSLVRGVTDRTFFLFRISKIYS